MNSHRQSKPGPKKVEATVASIQEEAASQLQDSPSLAEELILERREEAAKERGEGDGENS